MNRRILVWSAAILLAGLLLPATTVMATSEVPDDGIVIWNEDYTLAEGEQLNGDLVVFNGDVTLELGSRVQGDVVIWNGNAEVNSVVEGSLVTSNGDIRLGEAAHVQGDVVCTWNCGIERDENSRVDGQLIEGPSLRGIPFGQLGARGPRIQIPSIETKSFWTSGPEQLLRWILRMVRRAVTVLVIAAIGGLVALVWPDATAQVSQVVHDSPGTSLGVGFLTVIAGVALIVALAVTICLSPAAALLALALSAAGLLGWIGIGAWLGRRLLTALNAGDVTPLWSASLGTLIITLVTVGLSNAFCLSPLGWLFTVLVGCLGLGGVVLTRFGTTPYIPGRRREAVSTAAGPAIVEGSTELTIEEEDKGSTSKEEQDT